MKVITTEDVPVLIPNRKHKNFTNSEEVIEADTILYGEPKNIQGLRRGEPFTYKLFYTKDNKIIYLNKLKQMDTTEVTLGTDGSPSPTTIKLPPTAANSRKKLWGAVIGAGGGFAYAKYKKHDMKKAALYMTIGAVIGYAAGWCLEGTTKVAITPSK